MRVLITGGLGFVGHHVTRALLARGDDVTILDARTAPVHHPSDPRPVPEGARMVEGSVTSATDIDASLEDVDAVAHLAAYQDYLPDVHRFFDVNATGTALLVERVLARGSDVGCIVYASSQSVYGEGVVACPSDGVVQAARRKDADLARGDFEVRCSVCGKQAPPAPIPEAMTAPMNAYGISKLAGEQVVIHLASSAGVRGVALRYAIVHGDWQSPRNAYSGVLRAASVRAIEGKRPIVFEDGQSLRDYVSIDDVVTATLMALDDAAAHGAYNVGGPRSWSVLELLRSVSEATGLDLEPELPGLYRVGDVRHTLGDISRLLALGWAPQAVLTDTWSRYVSWLREHLPPVGTVDRALERMSKEGVLRGVNS